MMQFDFILNCDSCKWNSRTSNKDTAEWASDFHTTQAEAHTVTCWHYEDRSPKTDEPFITFGDGKLFYQLWTVTDKRPRRSLANIYLEDFTPDESTD